MFKYFELMEFVCKCVIPLYSYFNSLFQNGPMASGLKPQEASDRLIMFQVIFLVSMTFYTTETLICFKHIIFPHEQERLIVEYGMRLH